ncbi:hypothetical protein RS030_2295 [Cryptosporidium xiaoi]|uniref:Uncharacterized protein n=1 Tax=Cryptosporidium xiaoi TaxID=659607 RepID=A0AAV9XXK4_9CRYT
MVSLSVLSELLLIIINLNYSYSSISNNVVFNKNVTNLLSSIIDNKNTIYPVDASDLLECSKINGFILLDKTNELTSQETIFNDKLTYLESLYLSSQFFGIIESISGTRGNFINDAISGIQITNVIDVLKYTNVEVYIGTISHKLQLEKKVSNINLSCLYNDYCPSLTNYDYNNLCEYITTDTENRYMLVDNERLCSNKYINKNDLGKNMYFNVIASLKIPIINYKEVNHHLFSKLNQDDFYFNNQFNIEKYLLFSRELGISFTITFGFGLFNKLNTAEKYYMLMKMTPPKSFWVKDNYYVTGENNTIINDNSNVTPFECINYENGNKSFGTNNYVFHLKGNDNSDSKLILKSNSVSYITIFPKNTHCLNGYKIEFEIKGSNLINVRIYDDKLGFIEVTNEIKQNSNGNKYCHLIKNILLISKIQVIIINGSNKDSNLNYSIKCNNYKYAFKNLLSSIVHSFNNNIIKPNKAKEFAVAIDSKRLNIGNKYKTKESIIVRIAIVITIIIISVVILVILFSNNRRSENNNRINNIFNSNGLIKKETIQVNFITYKGKMYLNEFNNEIDNYSYRLITESNNEQNYCNASSNSTSPVTFKSISNNQQYSQDQIDLCTAVSNNIQHNTDCSSSPSTIKSITFKN